MPKHQEVFDLSRNHIAAILNDNQISDHDYNFVETDHGDYYFQITYTYSFHAGQNTNTVAGGNGIPDHHYTADAYQSHKAYYFRYAQNPHDEKLAFIRIAESKLIDFFKENESKVVWTAPTISYSYHCNECSGKGKVTCTTCNGSQVVTCSSCGGGGYVTRTKTEYDHRGNPHNFQVKVNCYGCGGRRVMTCSSCSGAGKKECSTCGGEGYFTEYCNTQCTAKPSTTYGAQPGIHDQKVVDYFLPHGNAYLCKVMTPELKEGTWLENGQYRFNLQALVTVVENTVTVQGEPFVEIAVNTVPGILCPPIFDHVLKEPCKKLDVASIKRQHVLGIYHAVKDHHAVDHALQVYGEAGDAPRAQKIEAVHDRIRYVTGGYISSGFSGVMSQRVVHFMSRLAPHGTIAPWLLVGMVCVLLEAILAAHMGYGPIHDAGSMSGFALLSAPLLAVEILVILLAIPAAVVNWGVTRYRQRGVPSTHRPQIYHRKPLMRVIGVVAIVWYLLIAAIFLTHYFSSDAYQYIVHYGTVFYDAGAKLFDFFRSIYSTVADWVIPHAKEWNWHVQHGHWTDPVLWAVIVCAFLIYFIPTIVAVVRRKNYYGWIFVGNLFLTPFTGLPWFLMLYLAFL